MTAAERDPAYGRLDRILAAAKVAHERGAEPVLNDSPLNGCWVDDGCRGQHTLAQHLAVEEVLNAGPTDDWEAQLIEAAGGAVLDRLRGMVAALEAECAAKDDLLDSIELYLDWRYVTRQLTTEQKLLFADAIDREAAGRGEGPVAERWWDWPDCEVCGQPIEERDGGWRDLRGDLRQAQSIRWAGSVGLTPPHDHAPAVVRAELETQP